MLAMGLFLSETFERIRLPYVVALIFAGILLGPLGLDIFELTPTILFFGTIGAVFLMFMAGIEIRTDILGRVSKKVIILAALNGIIPAIAGYTIAHFFGFDPFTAIIIGTIFISSSVAVIVPSLEERGLIETDIGAVIVGATIIEDMASLFILAIIFQVASPRAALPLPIFIAAFAIAVIGLKLILPRFETWFFSERNPDQFEDELRFVIIITIAVVILFEFLGIHPIIAGFLVGFVLSKIVRSHKLTNKLHAISYGIFIPIFLIEIGIETDLTAFASAGNLLIATFVIIVGLLASKLISGFIAGRLGGFSSKTSLLIGSTSIPQLSTTLAVAFVASELGLFDPSLEASIVVLSIVTVLIAPFLIRFLAPRVPETEEIIIEEEGEKLLEMPT
jgi:Kef-type K+ transport system membrane component KefB